MVVAEPITVGVLPDKGWIRAFGAAHAHGCLHFLFPLNVLPFEVKETRRTGRKFSAFATEHDGEDSDLWLATASFLQTLEASNLPRRPPGHGEPNSVSIVRHRAGRPKSVRRAPGLPGQTQISSWCDLMAATVFSWWPEMKRSGTTAPVATGGST